MFKRLFWVFIGVGIGVVAVTKAQAYVKANTPDTARQFLLGPDQDHVTMRTLEGLVNEFNADSSLGLTLEIISNSGEDIYDNIMSVVTSFIEGLVIAALVLVFFFGEWKSSFIVGVTMPISVLAALILMAAFDMSINLMSLGGLVVGIGMMVDSSIVVIDSCFKST